MGLRIAEIDENTVTHIFRHKPAEAADGLGDASLVSRNDLAQVLGVHACGERGRADQIGKHHRNLSTLGGIDRHVRRRAIGGEAGRLRVYAERGNGLEEPDPRTEWKAEFTKMTLREMLQDRLVDGVVAKDRLVPLKAKVPQPARDVHDGTFERNRVRVESIALWFS
jgi:hypothetical protein